MTEFHSVVRQLEEWPLEKLMPFQGDLKKRDEKLIKKLATRIKRKGFSAPFFVWQNYILDGHQRLEALKLLQAEGLAIKTVPVIVIEAANEKEAKERLLEYNTQYSSIDQDIFGDWAKELDLGELNLIGFDLSEKQEVKEDDVPAVPTEPKSKLGDMFQLGRHFLLCGDSTKKEDVERLMQGQKADMCFTDPPYNVGFQYASYQDHQPLEQWKNFCQTWLNIVKQYAPYICFTCGQGNVWIFYELEKENISMLTWHKKFSLSNGYISHAIVIEPILVIGKPKEKYATDYFEFMTEREKDLLKFHPCPKPVQLIGALIEKGIQDHGSVLDLFGGSGSTLIACEQLNRTCYMMELDPRYIDVIVQRFENLTDNKAIKL